MAITVVEDSSSGPTSSPSGPVFSPPQESSPRRGIRVTEDAPPPTLQERSQAATAKAETVINKAADWTKGFAKEFGHEAIHPTTGQGYWWDDFTSRVNAAVNSGLASVKEHARAVGEAEDPITGWTNIGGGVIDVLSTLWDASVGAMVHKVGVEPLQYVAEKAGGQVAKLAPDRPLTDTARRMESKLGMKPQGADWGVTRSDVAEQIAHVDDTIETGVQAVAAMFSGGFGAAGKLEALGAISKEEKAAFIQRAPKPPKDSVAAKVAERKIDTNLDALAVKNPEAATRLADEVEKVSPSLGKAMKLKVKMKPLAARTQKAQEDVGAEKVKAKVTSSFEQALKDMLNKHGGTSSRMEAEDPPDIFMTIGADWHELQNRVGPELHMWADAPGTISTHGVLDRMIEEANPGYVKSFLAKLREHVPDAPITVTTRTLVDHTGEAAPTANGMHTFTERGHEIQIQPGWSSMHTVAHEGVHAATVNFILSFPEHPLVKELDRLYGIAQQRLKNFEAKFGHPYPTRYGMKDKLEFVAESMSNYQFQDFLIHSERWASPGEKLGNIWNRLVGIIQRTLGIGNPRELQLLHNVMQVSQSIMEEQSKFEFTIKEGLSGTMKEVSQAMKKGGDPFVKPPVSSVLVGELAEWWNQLARLRRWVAPESMGLESKATGAIVAKGIAERRAMETLYWHKALDRRSFWNINAEKIPGFMKGVFQSAVKFKDAELQKYADVYRAWGRELDRKMSVLGAKYEPIDHWLPHAYSDAGAVARQLDYMYPPEKVKVGNKTVTTTWRSPGFLEKHPEVFEKLAANGFRPTLSNPEDFMLLRQHAFDVAEMKTNILQDMENFGFAIKAEDREKLPPEFSHSVTSPTGDKFWVHKDSAHIIKQAFNSKSLWAMQGLGGKAFRGAMALKNAMVTAQLFLSAFHPLHIIGIHWAATMSRSAELGLTGHRSMASMTADFIKSLSSDFISDPSFGGQIRRATRGTLKPGEKLTAEHVQAMKYMSEGGFAPEMSAQVKGQAVKNFMDAWEQGKARAVFHAPFAAIETIQAPIFQVWIPNLKIASYLKDVRAALQMDPSLEFDELGRIQRFRQIAKSVDNRYGEMAYDTLFWPKFMKDAAVLNTLSLGWQMGFLREYGGGALDLGQWAAKGDKLQAVKAGQLHKPLFLLTYNAGALAVGYLTTWALTGEKPKTFEDWVYPRTGEKNPDGTPSRVNTMYFTREFGSIYYHVRDKGLVTGLSQVAASKSSGFIGLLAEWATGINGFGQEISRQGDPMLKQLEEKLAYTLKGMQPISVRQAETGSGTAKSTTLSYLGFSPAPKYVSQTAGEAQISETYRQYHAPQRISYDKVLRSEDYHQLRQFQQKGDQGAFRQKLEEMQKKYEMSGGEIKRMARELASKETGPEHTFKHLEWSEQQRILKDMPPEERKKYLPLVSKEHRKRAEAIQ